MIDAAATMFLVPGYMIGTIIICEISRRDQAARMRRFYTFTLVYLLAAICWIARMIMLLARG